MLVTLFYGVGGHVHNIGCYYLKEKFYNLMNIHFVKKFYKGKTLIAVLKHVEKSNQVKSMNQKSLIEHGII